MGDVVLERDGAVLTVAMAAPNGINGLTSQVRRDLIAAFTGPAAEPDVRAVVLRGRGRSFCVGQDLRELSARLDTDPATALDVVAAEYSPMARAVRGVEKPVVAGISGACAGAGISLALACDVRIVSDTSRFTFAFAGVGLAADAGLHHSLVAQVGAARARALLLLDRPVEPPEALTLGLADVVVAPADFESTLAETAARLAAGPTRAYAAIKATTRLAETAAFEQVLEAENGVQRDLGLTADHAAAVKAFLAKDTPAFIGA